MESFSDNVGVFLANNNKAPKVEPPTVIQFVRKYNDSPDEISFELSSIITDLNVDTIMSHLTKDMLGEADYARFWKKDATWEMGTFGTTWECKFNIHVNGANHNTRPLNLSQAKTLTLAQILQDKNTSNPFVCEVTLAAIKPGGTCMHMYS